MLSEGQQAPDFQLDLVDGDTLELEEILEQDRHAVLVFLRHLG